VQVGAEEVVLRQNPRPDIWAVAGMLPKIIREFRTPQIEGTKIGGKLNADL